MLGIKIFFWGERNCSENPSHFEVNHAATWGKMKASVGAGKCMNSIWLLLKISSFIGWWPDRAEDYRREKGSGPVGLTTWEHCGGVHCPTRAALTLLTRVHSAHSCYLCYLAHPSTNRKILLSGNYFKRPPKSKPISQHKLEASKCFPVSVLNLIKISKMTTI